MGLGSCKQRYSKYLTLVSAPPLLGRFATKNCGQLAKTMDVKTSKNIFKNVEKRDKKF